MIFRNKHKNQPLVSIIIPSFNRGCYIGETLDSVLNQTYSHWECIVVDDGSTDFTMELMEFYCTKDERIKFIPRPSKSLKGANSCRNIGFASSKGDYIQFLDSDDLLGECKIELQIDLMKKQNGNSVVICPWAAFRKIKEKHILKNDAAIFRSVQSPLDLFTNLGKFSFYLPPHCYLVTREQIIKAGCWNENLTINQDGEFFSRLLLLVDEVRCTFDCAVYYRRNWNITTSTLDSLAKAEDLVRSWKLIDQQHRLKFKIREVPYVEGAKKVIFRTLIREGFISVVLSNGSFFRDQIKWGGVVLKLRIKQIFQKSGGRK